MKHSIANSTAISHHESEYTESYITSTDDQSEDSSAYTVSVYSRGGQAQKVPQKKRIVSKSKVKAFVALAVCACIGYVAFYGEEKENVPASQLFLAKLKTYEEDVEQLAKEAKAKALAAKKESGLTNTQIGCGALAAGAVVGGAAYVTMG